MADWYGYKGIILRVDLTNRTIRKQALPEEWARQYIGCRGINSKILWDEIKPGIDPYGPDNVLIFGTGPLEGTNLGMGRISMTTLSPRRTLGEGGIGGFWGPELKFAGYDFVVITGAANKPVYLWIQDEKVEIRDASHIWGKNTWQTETLIQNELHDPDVQVRCIGPAGENLVHSSPVFGNYNRAGGRAGLGDVMGSKKLKAIAVRGSGGVQLANPEKYLELYGKIRDILAYDKCMDAWNVPWGTFGGLVLMRIFNSLGNLQTRNAQEMRFDEGIDSVCGERVLLDHAVRPRACFSCPYPSCGKYYEVKDGPYAGTTGENTSALELFFTSLVGVDYLPAGLKARSLCNQLGLDVMHVGYAISWAMETYEKGIINKSYTGGLELNFGNHEVMMELIRRIAFREDEFSSLLADGVETAAKTVGKGSEDWALCVKGQELEGMGLRNFYTAALGIATSESGPDHTRWYPPYPPHPATVNPEVLVRQKLEFNLKDVFQARKKEGRGLFMKWMTDSRAVIESLPYCVFLLRSQLGLDFSYWVEAINATTGYDYDFDELIKVGERIMNLERAFIVREGFRREHDTLPFRMRTQPAPDGGYPELDQETMDYMLDEYYQARGWDKETAIPTKEKLQELDLNDVVKEFERKVWA